MDVGLIDQIFVDMDSDIYLYVEEAKGMIDGKRNGRVLKVMRYEQPITEHRQLISKSPKGMCLMAALPISDLVNQLADAKAEIERLKAELAMANGTVTHKPFEVSHAKREG